MKCLALSLVLLVASCGSRPPVVEPTPTGEGSAKLVLPDVPFEKLDHEQRIAFMKQKVMPVMKPIFQNHDAKDFAAFGCDTCHGKKAKEGHFEMPNPDLPKLNFADLGKYEKADLEWMGKEVEPTMGKILGLELYSESNPTGFGCLACHTQEAK